MLKLIIPGAADAVLEHVIFDFNGTLAVDGLLIEGVQPLLNALAKQLQIHVVTGDTCGTAKAVLAEVNCTVSIIQSENQGLAKLAYLQQLGADSVVAIGNGQNDVQIVEAAKIGILVLGPEGAAVTSLLAADVVAPDILSAINLLLSPRRLVSTLRA